MAVAPYKTFIPGEVLTAADLNNSILQILNNGDDLASPATKAHDMDGFAIVLDADGDTQMRANTNNRIDFTLAGSLLFELDGTAGSPINGFNFTAATTTVAPQIKSFGLDVNIDLGLTPKGTGVVQVINGLHINGTDLQVNGAPIQQFGDSILAMRSFG